MIRLRRPARANLLGPSVLVVVLAVLGWTAAHILADAGQDFQIEAERHRAEAVRRRSSEDYGAALWHAEQALALWEKAVGRQSADVARSLLLLAQINDARANFAVAESQYVRARAISEGGPERNELLAAAILDSYADNLIARGRFREAEPLVSESLAIRTRVAGPAHVLAAASLATLADLQHESGNVQDAAITAKRALDIATRTYASTDVALGDFVNRVARSELALGNYARAEQLYRETLAARDRTAGSETLTAAESLGGLARVALLSNDNVAAEERHRRTLAIKERVLGPDHPLVANDVFNLALLSYRRRDFTSALALYARALAIREQTFGRSHPSIAITLNNMGLVYWRERNYPRAEELFGQALELSEQLYGADSLRMTNALGNLGIIAKETGRYAVAEARYRRALAIKEKHLGTDHPELITLVESLAILYRDRGDYPQAEQLFRRTISLTTRSLGPQHPFVARHLANLGQLYWAMAQWEKAFSARQRVVAIEERNLPLELSVGSERQKLAYFEPLLRDLEETIAFHVQQPADHPGSRDLAVTTLLQRKGRILDVLADSFSAFRTRATPENHALLEQLSMVTSELAAAVLTESTRIPVAERQRRAAMLADERERLEIEVHRRSAGYLDVSRPLTLAAVQDAVPPDAALVEFGVYRPFDPRLAVESETQRGEAHYVAYVVRHRAETRWKDLGPAAEIDRAVHRFRTGLADPRRPDVRRRASELHRLLIAPLRPLLADTRHLLISPDGALNLIPFEALRDGQGRYLVEDRLISYVTSGRDLVRMRSPRPLPGPSAIFADAAFGEPKGKSSPSFARLAGTAGEAQRIHALFPDATLRSGATASEHALKSLHAPRILHIATHGFFLQEGSAAASSSPDTLRALRTNASIDNPLLRSGLALAGANLRRSREEDGILTALEAANLDLWGTKLVTLSACDTGNGVVRTGEGVYGLRRAFVLAGTETLVMSLWPVSDLITRETMAGYYAGLKEGLGRGAALRRMQLRMLRRPGRAHPFYWASFIQAGEWASLDGRR
jgi:CHAT domain-containing protein